MSREKTNIYSLFVDYVPGYMLDVLYVSSHLFCIPIMTDVIITLFYDEKTQTAKS